MRYFIHLFLAISSLGNLEAAIFNLAQNKLNIDNTKHENQLHDNVYRYKISRKLLDPAYLRYHLVIPENGDGEISAHTQDIVRTTIRNHRKSSRITKRPATIRQGRKKKLQDKKRHQNVTQKWEGSNDMYVPIRRFKPTPVHDLFLNINEKRTKSNRYHPESTNILGNIKKQQIEIEKIKKQKNDIREDENENEWKKIKKVEYFTFKPWYDIQIFNNSVWNDTMYLQRTANTKIIREKKLEALRHNLTLIKQSKPNLTRRNTEESNKLYNSISEWSPIYVTHSNNSEILKESQETLIKEMKSKIQEIKNMISVNTTASKKIIQQGLDALDSNIQNSQILYKLSYDELKHKLNDEVLLQDILNKLRFQIKSSETQRQHNQYNYESIIKEAEEEYYNVEKEFNINIEDARKLPKQITLKFTKNIDLARHYQTQANYEFSMIVENAKQGLKKCQEIFKKCIKSLNDSADTNDIMHLLNTQQHIKDVEIWFKEVESNISSNIDLANLWHRDHHGDYESKIQNAKEWQRRQRNEFQNNMLQLQYTHIHLQKQIRNLIDQARSTAKPQLLKQSIINQHIRNEFETTTEPVTMLRTHNNANNELSMAMKSIHERRDNIINDHSQVTLLSQLYEIHGFDNILNNAQKQQQEALNGFDKIIEQSQARQQQSQTELDKTVIEMRRLQDDALDTLKGKVQHVAETHSSSIAEFDKMTNLAHLNLEKIKAQFENKIRNLSPGKIDQNDNKYANIINETQNLLQRAFASFENDINVTQQMQEELHNDFETTVADMQSWQQKVRKEFLENNKYARQWQQIHKTDFKKIIDDAIKRQNDSFNNMMNNIQNTYANMAQQRIEKKDELDNKYRDAMQLLRNQESELNAKVKEVQQWQEQAHNKFETIVERTENWQLLAQEGFERNIIGVRKWRQTVLSEFVNKITAARKKQQEFLIKFRNYVKDLQNGKLDSLPKTDSASWLQEIKNRAPKTHIAGVEKGSGYFVKQNHDLKKSFDITGGTKNNEFKHSFDITGGPQNNEFKNSFDITGVTQSNDLKKSFDITGGTPSNDLKKSFDITGGTQNNEFKNSFDIPGVTQRNDLKKSFDIAGGTQNNEFKNSFDITGGTQNNEFKNSFDIPGVTQNKEFKISFDNPRVTPSNEFKNLFDITGGTQNNEFKNSFNIAGVTQSDELQKSFDITGNSQKNKFKNSFDISGNTQNNELKKSLETFNAPEVQQQAQDAGYNTGEWLKPDGTIMQQDTVVNDSRIWFDETKNNLHDNFGSKRREILYDHLENIIKQVQMWQKEITHLFGTESRLQEQVQSVTEADMMSQFNEFYKNKEKHFFKKEAPMPLRRNSYKGYADTINSEQERRKREKGQEWTPLRDDVINQPQIHSNVDFKSKIMQALDALDIAKHMIVTKNEFIKTDSKLYNRIENSRKLLAQLQDEVLKKS